MIYSDYYEKRLSLPKNVFICYRGALRIGGMIANLIYNNMLMSKYEELGPFYAPVSNVNTDFQQRSKEVISSCKVFIAVFTEDFFSSDVPEDDQIRKELIMLAHRMYQNKQSGNQNVGLLPVFVNMPVAGMQNKAEKADFSTKKTFCDQLKKWLLDGYRELNATIFNELYPEVKKSKKVAEKYVEKAILSMINKFQHGSNHSMISEGSVLDDVISLIIAQSYSLYKNRPQISDGYIWVGTRLSDIEGIDDVKFRGAVTLFGETDESKNLYALCDSNTRYRVDHNAISEEQDKFIFDTVSRMAKENPEAKFYFYNQNAYYNVRVKDTAGNEKMLGNEIADNCVCVNSVSCTVNLNNKKLFHEKFAAVGCGKGLLEVFVVNYHECEYKKLCKAFGVDVNEGCKFIVQEMVASGGNGTYIMTAKNESKLRKILNAKSEYLLSIYREKNVPVNMHAIIFDDGVLFTPGSIQVMRVDYESIDGLEETRKLMYRGADFIEYERISRLADTPENKVNGSHIGKFKELCAELCNEIKKTGYRGVLGIDGIIYGDEVRLLEVNCRFQASTSLINRALKEKGQPSLQKMNLSAMYGGTVEDFADCFTRLNVGYSNYSYNHIGEDEHVERIYAACEKGVDHVCGFEKDGFVPCREEDVKKDSLNTTATASHLFRVVFNTNICWVNEDGAVNLDECVSEPVKEFKNKIFAVDSETERGKVLPENMLALKIALLTQGVNFVADDPDELRNRVRPATNDAVDMLFGSKYYGAVINAPLNNKFQLFSPFDLKEIDAVSMKFKLYYYGEEITEVTLYKTDPLEFNYDGSLRKTRDGRYTYRDVAYLSTDRLRVHVTNKCIYKTRSENGKSKSCKFCNIMPSCEDINLNAIKEVVSEHWKQHEESGLTHFLIGGQSPVQNQETIDNIVSIIKIIKDIREGGDPNIPPTLIYAMILPCGKESIEKMVTAGLTHLSFNIEIFDDKCAKKYMPGKGSISRETYKKSLLDALCVYMNDKKPEKREEAYKAVRSMVILGLEPEETFMEGMRWMIKEHIQPIISIFRPLNGTELSNLVAPSMISVYNIFFRLQKMINDKNGYSQNDNKVRYCFLGPDCRYCQNNTLSLPLDIKL